MFKIILLFLLSPVVFAQIDAIGILKKVDAYRSPYKHSQLEIKITAYKNQQQGKTQKYRIYNQDDKSLVLILSGVDKNNRILLSDKGMFVAVKNSSRAIRITPIQRLLGQASYGDLAGLSFSQHYTPTIIDSKKDIITLELLAKKSSATYQKIILLVASDDYHPIKAVSYLASGKLYKQMIYKVKNKLVSSISYFSPKNKHKKTVMTFLSITAKKLPKRFFSSRGMRNKI